MAGQITHILAGEAALMKAAPRQADRILDAAGAFFRLGCQGPDIFYHNQRTKPSGLHYGSLAHRRGYGTLVAAAASSLGPDDRELVEPAAAYLLGLSTHAAVDRATHPFIVFFSGWHDPAKPGSERYRSCHPFLERLLDVGLLRERCGLEAEDCDIAALLGLGTEAGASATELPARPGHPAPVSPSGHPAPTGTEAELVALWAAGLRAAYPSSTRRDFLLERRIENALSDGRYFYEITNPAVTALNPDREDWFAYIDDRAGARSVALVYPVLPVEGADPLNLAREVWEHPAGDGRSSRASYLDLVEEGVEAAAAAIEAVLPALGRDAATAAERRRKTIVDAIGEGGLSVADPLGHPLPPRLSRPLPLLEIMESEYRNRLDWARRNLGGASN